VNPIRKTMKIASVAALCVFAALICFPLSGCNKTSEPAAAPTPAPTASDAPTTPRKYTLKGTVVSVNAANKSANIDSQAIPGFMDAMAMDYDVHNAADLAKLKPKEKITADLVVAPNGAYIENVVIAH
jgi:Cu/Ag efflux protein CusF